MAGRFVRASKYRHVYGQPTKKEQCYDNLRISKNAWDTNLIKANPEYISVNWEASGGGAFAVVPINERGKLPDRLPLFRGHTGAVLDTDWNPFDDHLLASGSDDGKVFLWRVPEGFSLYSDAEDPVDIAPVGRLTGHARKVGHVLFNSAAQNVLASSSGDFNVKIWDIEQGKDRLVLKHNEIVQSMSWNENGSLLATTSRDKKLRIWDTRTEKPAFEVPGHAGAKNSRAVWLGSHDRIATTGFSKMSDRQLGLWDARNPGEPIGGFQILDSISGVCMPFWDDGNQILYLAGKGDGNIRYFEYANDKFEYLTEYKSAEPQRGIAFVPKRGVNVHENEIARAYKTVADSYIEPISFIVPRRAEVFQDDIYPPTTGLRAGVSAADWFTGKAATPPLISLRGKYEGGEAEQLPADQQPTQRTVSAAPPASKPEPKPAPAAAPVSNPDPTPAPREIRTKLEDNKQAMSSMADKFADRDEDTDDDDASSFEEVAKPVERPARITPLTSPPQSATPTTSSFGARSAAAAPSSTSNTAATRQPPTHTNTNMASSASKPDPAPPSGGSATPTTGSGLAAGLGGHLAEIKAATAATHAEVAELRGQVRELQELVRSLAGAQSERIRRVELEMESLRE